MNTDRKQKSYLCSSVFISGSKIPFRTFSAASLACPSWVRPGVRGSVVGVGRDHAKTLGIDLVRRGNGAGSRTGRGDPAVAQRCTGVGRGNGVGGVQGGRQTAEQLLGGPLPIDLRVPAAQGQGQRDGRGGE